MTDPVDWEVERRGIVTNAASIGLAVAAYGVSFGAISVTGGLSVLQTQVLSALMFTGASQFAFVGVVVAGGGAASAVATSVLLGVRNSFYGLSMAPILRVRGVRRWAAAHLTLDESAAMAVSRSTERDGGRASRLAFWATGLSVFVFWNLATLLGALGAGALGDPKVWGLDAAIPAGFIALVWPRLKDSRSWSIGIAAAVVALALTPFLRPGVPVLVTAVVAVVAGVLAVRSAGDQAAASPVAGRSAP